MKTKTKLLFLFVALFFINQVVKYFVSSSICNKNIAWNIPVAPAIFYLAWFVIIAALIYIFVRTDNYWRKLFLVLILSGAFSNMIDRIRFGCVVDYIDLKFWPVFNLGDVYITIGIVLLLFSFIKSK